MAITPSLFSPPPFLSHQNQLSNLNTTLNTHLRCHYSRREAIMYSSVAIPSICLAPRRSSASEIDSSSEKATDGSRNKQPFLNGIANTKSWFQFIGDGFSIRVPPQFDDITEPEEYNVDPTYYGDKAKIKPFAARFASQDKSEVVSVIIKPSNQLKITFLEAGDITDLGSLKDVAKIFVPGGANLYSARSIKVKEDEMLKTYYFYEFAYDKQHVALVAAINSGKTYIAGATAPETNWENDGVKLRSAAISLSIA